MPTTIVSFHKKLNLDSKLLIEDCIKLLQNGGKEYTTKDKYLFGLLQCEVGLYIEATGNKVDYYFKIKSEPFTINNKKELAGILELILKYIV